MLSTDMGSFADDEEEGGTDILTKQRSERVTVVA